MGKKKEEIQKVRAEHVEGALRERHGEDYYFSQVKIGSAGARIMDGFAFVPTWSPITYIGYEIKVSRSDFLRDDKYFEYLPYCHEFYFVAPKGILQIEELPDGIGYIEFYPKSGTLRMKRKAARRQIEGINPALHHIFMWKMEAYKRWTKQDALEHHQTKMSSKPFGRSVSEKIAILEGNLSQATYDAERLHELENKVRIAFNYSVGLKEVVEMAIKGKDTGGVELENKVRELQLQLRRIKRIIESTGV